MLVATSLEPLQTKHSRRPPEDSLKFRPIHLVALCQKGQLAAELADSKAAAISTPWAGTGAITRAACFAQSIEKQNDLIFLKSHLGTSSCRCILTQMCSSSLRCLDLLDTQSVTRTDSYIEVLDT